MAYICGKTDWQSLCKGEKLMAAKAESKVALEIDLYAAT